MTESEPSAARTFARRADIAAVAAMLTIVVAFFWHLAFTTDQLYTRDGLRFSLPMRLFMVSELRQGRWPLWFPYDACGVPFVGQLATGVFHPLNLVYAFVDFARAYQLNYLLAWAVAAVGMYLWARGRGVTPLGAAVGGLSFALCGALVSQTNLTFLVANASVPLAVAAGEWFLRRPSVLRALAASCGVALPFLAGDPQSLVFGALLLLLVALFEPGRLRRVAGLAAVGIGAGVLSAVQLLPAIAAFRASARIVTGVDRDVWSFPPLRLLELLVPNMFAEGSGHELFAHAYGHYPWAPRLFVGPVVLALALLASRDRRARSVAVFVVLSAWLALGPAGGLDSLLAQLIPWWSGLRYPEKLVAFLSAGLAMLAALGFDAALAAGARRAFGAVTGVAIVIAWVALALGREPAGMGELFAHMRLLAAEAAAVAATSLVVVALAPKLPKARAAALLAALSVGPLFAFNFDAPHYLGASDFFVNPWTAQTIRDDAPAGLPPRVATVAGSRVHVAPGVDPTFAVTALKRAELAPDFNALYEIGSFSAYMPATDAVHGLVTSLPRDVYYDRMLPIFAVDYLVVSAPDFEPPPRWALFRRDDVSGIRLFKPTTRLERVFVAPSAVQVPDGPAALALLANPQFPPGSRVTAECPLEPGDGEVRMRGTAQVVSADPSRLTIAAHMRAPGFVVVNDALATGWRATIDGEPAELCRVNGFVRGLRVAAGEHTVELRYAPPSFALGGGISLASVVAWLGAGLALELRRRRALV